MLTQERVKQLFICQEDGVLVRRVSVIHNAKEGTVTGCPDKFGYLQTNVDGRHHFNHRLVWLYHKGYLPEGGIDHIDRDVLNNRLDNLREVSQSCNVRNSKLRQDNTSGVKGVSWSNARKCWLVQIKPSPKLNTVVAGWSQDFVSAVCIRLAAEQCLNWDGCDSTSSAFLCVQEYLASPQLRD